MKNTTFYGVSKESWRGYTDVSDKVDCGGKKTSLQ